MTTADPGERWFHLRRVDLRRRIEFDYASDDYDAMRWLGDETRWMANVPLVYQALAAHGGRHDLCRKPQIGKDDPGVALTYWASLLHPLVFSFGWRVPGAGLRWWVDHGYPAADDRLALISQVWVRDGWFDWFCAWLWTANPTFMPRTSASEETSYPSLDLEWLRTVEASIPLAPLVFSPHRPGHPDPLHLWDHFHVGLMRTDVPVQLVRSEATASGVLLADSFAAWYPFLHETPLLKEPSSDGQPWRIDVVVKSVGWIGTYERSPITGRWYSGPHALHLAGNPG